MSEQQNLQAVTVFEAAGGMATFERLVERFYEGVETDPLLRPLYPEDLTDSKRHLALFLAQYFGGPTTYSAERGHPRLRMRHIPFAIGPAERDAWLRHMLAAVDAEPLAEPVRAALQEYFSRAADFLMNRS
jgi:hemoglobin